MTQCEYWMELPFRETRQCSRQAMVELTYAPDGSAYKRRDTIRLCSQHTKGYGRGLCVTDQRSLAQAEAAAMGKGVR